MSGGEGSHGWRSQSAPVCVLINPYAIWERPGPPRKKTENATNKRNPRNHHRKTTKSTSTTNQVLTFKCSVVGAWWHLFGAWWLHPVLTKTMHLVILFCVDLGWWNSWVPCEDHTWNNTIHQASDQGVSDHWQCALEIIFYEQMINNSAMKMALNITF